MSPRIRTLFLVVVSFLIWIVLAVFAFIIATLFVSNPGSIFPINVQILFAMTLGWMAYRRRIPLLAPSIVAYVLLLGAIGIGNDVALCECATVPTSSVAHDADGVVETAMTTLARLMNGETLQHTTIRVPPLGVVTRQSTDVLAATDSNVVNALRFMWEHLTEDLSVDQIAEHVGVSRRTLEKAFEQGLGRGINQEFQRRRLEKACELLVHTDLKVAEIADALNFNSQNYFSRAFRKAFATSPGRYRSDYQARR